MERKNYVIAIDLGSMNVTVAIAEKNEQGLLDIVSIVQAHTKGMRAGQIENIELVGQSIREVITKIEKELGIHITEAYAGISGEFVRCARHTDHVFVSDPDNGVNHNDVQGLFDRMRNVQAPEGEVIMERVPQNYIVDDNQEVENPEGSFTRKLSSTFNFILCQKTPMQRLELALKRMKINILDVLPNSLYMGESVLVPDEKDEGVAVVNVGAELTDVAVYYRNVVRYIATIPMGASAINHDIRSMGIPEKTVEKLKLKVGSAVADLAPEDRMVRLNGHTGRDSKEFLVRNIAAAIEARATDIVEYVMQEIRDSGYYDKLAYGIVLTGGSARLTNLDELFRRVTGMEVRVALPEIGFTEETAQALDNPSYTTVTGLLLRGAQLGMSSVLVQSPETDAPVAEAKPAEQPVATPVEQPAPVEHPAAVEPAPVAEPEQPAVELSKPEQPAAEPSKPESEPDPEFEPDPSPKGKTKGWLKILKDKMQKLNNQMSSSDEDDEL